MPKTTPGTDDLARLRDELRAEIRQAHETLKDLQREIREARELIPLLTDELFTAEVERQVTALDRRIRQAMSDATTRVIAQFDKLHDVLTGQGRRERRTGEPSIPDLINARARRDTTPETL